MGATYSNDGVLEYLAWLKSAFASGTYRGPCWNYFWWRRWLNFFFALFIGLQFRFDVCKVIHWLFFGHIVRIPAQNLSTLLHQPFS